MSTSTLQRVTDYLFGADDAPAARTRTTRPATPLPAALLNSAAPLPPRLQAGSMQMVGLQHVRDGLGDQWEARRDRLHRVVESVLRSWLEAADVHYRLDDDQYLILFVHLDQAQAAAKAEAIAREVRKLILGELPEGYDLHVESTVATVERDYVNKVGSLNELLAHVKAGGSHSCGDAEMFGMDAHSGSAASAGPAAAPLTGAGPDMADLDMSLAGLFQKKPAASYLKECQASFTPAFSTRRRAFSFYPVEVIHTPTGLRANSDDPFLDDPQELEFMLDRYRLTTALLGLHRMITSGLNGIISVPVTFETLAVARTRNAYIARLKDLPGGLYRYLVLTIINIPEGTPASRIADAINYIAPFCASRILRLQADQRLIDLYAETGCHGFEVAMPTEIEDFAKRAQALCAFAKRAAWHKKEAILSNVSNRDDLAVGIAADFSFLSGNAIAPLLETPGLRAGLQSTHIPPRATAAMAR